jgi:hypothetical protein
MKINKTLDIYRTFPRCRSDLRKSFLTRGRKKQYDGNHRNYIRSLDHLRTSQSWNWTRPDPCRCDRNDRLRNRRTLWNTPMCYRQDPCQIRSLN